MSYWNDEDWIERVLIPTCRDRNFLKKMSGILDEEDFKPKRQEGMWEAYYIAQKAFKYWRDYREPIGGMLRTEMKDYIRENKKKVGKKNQEKILDLVDRIRHSNGSVAIEAIEKKVIDYKRRREMSRSIRELIDLQEKGELDDKKWYKICKKAVERRESLLRVSHYEDEVDKRVQRREQHRNREFPVLFIDALDAEIRTFPRGELGIVLAKYNVGKSTAAVHLAKAYALQGYNVMLVTLEDIPDMVEDRLDASLSNIPMRRLMDKSKKLKRRLRRALEKIRGKIRIIDGTSGGITVNRIEEIWDNFRSQGFTADVVIVDADEGLEPMEHYKGDSGERRESQENYKYFKTFCAKREVWGWMMAQAQRGKSGKRKMIVTGDDSATDISKFRRCAFAIGVGDGPEEWGDEGRCIFIAKNRYDKARKTYMIAGDYKRAIFYDPERTRELNEPYHKKHLD